MRRDLQMFNGILGSAKMATLTGRLALLATVTLFFSASNAASIQRRDFDPPLELDGGWEYEGCYV